MQLRTMKEFANRLYVTRPAILSSSLLAGAGYRETLLDPRGACIQLEDDWKCEVKRLILFTS